MELFTVTCTTCQQRLEVRDESAIGEIQICPKCGSMVLIHPASSSPARTDQTPPIAPDESAPPGPLLPPVADVDVESFDIEDSDAERPDAERPAAEGPAVEGPDTESLDTESPDTESPASSAAEPPRQDVVEPPVSIPPKLPPRVDQEQFADVEQDGEEATDDLLLPTDNGTPKIPRNRQQWLWIGGGALAGIVLAVSVFGFVASRAFTSRRPEDPVSPQQVAATETAAEEADPAVGPGAETQPPVDHMDAPAAQDATSDTPAVASTPDEPTLDEPTLDEPAEPREATPPAMDAEHGETTTSPAATAAADDHPEGTDGDPVGDASLPESPVDQPPDSDLSSASLAETLDTFAPFIDPEAFVPTPGTPPLVQENPPELESNESGDDVLDVPRPEPREVDVDQRLADEIPSIEFRNVPLKAFIRFLMGFSTIPITLDPDALTLVGVTPDTRINLQQANTTIGRALAEALAPLRLGIEVLGDQILVTRASSADTPLRTLAHPVDDLVAGDPTRLDELAGMIVDMVEPDSWDAQGGEGSIRPEMPSLVIRQRDTELFRAIVFCERLRTARGLPPQSNFDPALFELEPRFSRVAKGLRRPVTLNYIEPTSFVQILDQLSDEAGLQILIDWRAISGLGWNPDAETTISANADPVGEVLSEILRPMGMTYRVVSPVCIQVTSPDRLETHLDIEFFAVADLLSSGLTSDELSTRIRAELGEARLDEVGATHAFDPPSGFLIAALPQPLQRKLFALLEELRTAQTSSGAGGR